MSDEIVFQEMEKEFAKDLKDLEEANLRAELSFRRNERLMRVAAINDLPKVERNLALVQERLLSEHDMFGRAVTILERSFGRLEECGLSYPDKGNCLQVVREARGAILVDKVEVDKKIAKTKGD